MAETITDLDELVHDLELSADRLAQSFKITQSEFEVLGATTAEFVVTLREELPIDLQEAAGDLEQHLQSMAEDWAREVGARLEQESHEFESNLTAAKEAVERAEEQVEQEFLNAHGDLKELEGELQEASQLVEQIQIQAKQTLDEIEEEWAALQQDLAGDFDEFQSDVTEQLQTAIAGSTEDLNDLVEKYHQDLIPGAFSEVAALLEGARKDLHQVYENAAKELQADLDELLKELEDYAKSTAQHKIEERFKRLLENAIQAILEEIAIAIIKTELGASVTSALTPVLPQLIALHKIVEGIRGAIENWKRLKDAVGL